MKLCHQSGGVPGGAAGQFAFVEKDNVRVAELGQMIRYTATGNAAADDSDVGVFEGHKDEG